MRVQSNRSAGFRKALAGLCAAWGSLPRGARLAGLSLMVVVGATLAFGPLPAAGQDILRPPTSTDNGVITAGDMLRIQVWRQEEFSGEFFVTEQGVIAHPLFRTIEVARRPVEEVEALVQSFMLDYLEEPNLVVEAFFQVAVGGEVRQPDVHFLRPGTTVAQTVAIAGGISDRGRLDRVILRRDGVDYRIDLTDPAVPYRNTTIRSRDEIIVDRRRDVFREYVVPIISVAGSIASIIRLASPGR